MGEYYGRCSTFNITESKSVSVQPQTSSSRPQRIIPRPSKVSTKLPVNTPEETQPKEPCRYYIAGGCRTGDSCRFRHDVEPPAAASKKKHALAEPKAVPPVLTRDSVPDKAPAPKKSFVANNNSTPKKGFVADNNSTPKKDSEHVANKLPTPKKIKGPVADKSSVPKKNPSRTPDKGPAQEKGAGKPGKNQQVQHETSTIPPEGASTPQPKINKPRLKRGEAPCHDWTKAGSCTKGNKCFFAHDPELQAQRTERRRQDTTARRTSRVQQERIVPSKAIAAARDARLADEEQERVRQEKLTQAKGGSCILM
ncbi:hypothetical protein BDY19DRAFT_909266 [Irpex rosettiformis]|uniref:Uncharacterized protein n=1 Tax=Irpex rosettiformis TaxID=378272 RepID=A0ACB8TT25_9APHY|nr:hypothetical protein BDY19DRAFT_909266 [Irpex rosettiformis]